MVLIRRTLVIVAVVIALGVVAFGAFAWWVLQPAVLKAVAEARLTAALGQPVTIGTARVAFLPALSVAGTNISIGGAAGAPASSLQMSAIRMYPRLSSLFRRPVVIERVDIDGLALNVRRTADGRWVLPLPDPRLASAPAAPGSSEGTAIEVSEIVLKNGRLVLTDDPAAGGGAHTAVTPVEGVRAVVHHAEGVTRFDDLTASVGRSKVAGTGQIGANGLQLSLRWNDLRPADLPDVFALIGSAPPHALSIEGRNPLTLDLRVDAGGNVAATGKVAADRIAFGTLGMTSFQSPLRLTGTAIRLDPLAFRAYGGAGRGAFAANLRAAPLSWTLDVSLQHVNINDFLSANTTARDKVSGIGQMDARLRGTSRAPMERTVAGNVALSIANGTIYHFALPAALDAALRVGSSGDPDMHFQTLSGSFLVADARATTNDLVARTGDYTLSAAGTIGFDQTLDLKGKAVYAQGKSAALIRSVKELSALTNDAGEIEVPVTISGTASSPRFTIDVVGAIERAAGKEIKRRIQDKLRDLLGKIKK